MDNKNVKIAIPTNNGTRISGHFGPTKQYLVVTVENGEITNKETREKFSHHRGSHNDEEMHRMHQLNHGEGNGNHNHDHHHGESHGDGHGHGAGQGHHHRNHNQMIENILDCDYMVVGGMGKPVFEACENEGIKPILTDIKDVDEAVKAIIDGSIINHKNQLH